MKKIISVLLAVVLLLAFCTIPASAASAKSEWQKQTGPGKLEFNEQGVKCVFDEGLTFFKYTKEMVDCKNFTCTFIPHFTEKSNAYFAITLTASKGYTGTGSQGLFLLMRVLTDGTLNVEGQILHTGYQLTDKPLPRSQDIKVDTSKPITVHGKDNGNGTYTITAEGGTGEYKFDIPENYMFTEDANGQSYLTIGGTMNEGNAPRAMTIVSVNGIDFSGNKPETSSNKPTSSDSTSTTDDADSSTDTDDGLIIGADDNTTTATGNDDTNTESGSNSTLIIVIIVCGVLVLAAVAAVVVVILKKKAVSQEETEENSEESAE